MAHAWDHAVSSAKRLGGTPEAHFVVHEFLDDTKRCYADFRHRALRHHAEGIFLAERVLGVTIDNGEGKALPVRVIAEQHVREDLGGWIPTAQDWLRHIKPERWMLRGAIANDEPRVVA